MHTPLLEEPIKIAKSNSKPFETPFDTEHLPKFAVATWHIYIIYGSIIRYYVAFKQVYNVHIYTILHNFVGTSSRIRDKLFDIFVVTTKV